MQQIYLTQAFVKHYPGTIFELEGPEESDFAPTEPISREKMTPDILNIVYKIPDTGRGQAGEIPLSWTKVLPAPVCTAADCNDGPCRITSFHTNDRIVSEKTKNIYFLPDGGGPLELGLSENNKKHLAILHFDWINTTAKIQVKNRVSARTIMESTLSDGDICLDFSHLYPGFYEISIQARDAKNYLYTMLKLFPKYIDIEKSTHPMTLADTIW